MFELIRFALLQDGLDLLFRLEQVGLRGESFAEELPVPSKALDVAIIDFVGLGRYRARSATVLTILCGGESWCA